MKTSELMAVRASTSKTSELMAVRASTSKAPELTAEQTSTSKTFVRPFVRPSVRPFVRPSEKIEYDFSESPLIHCVEESCDPEISTTRFCR